MAKSSFVWLSMLLLLYVVCSSLYPRACVDGKTRIVFGNVSTGQEDPSLPLHNAIFCTKWKYCTESSLPLWPVLLHVVHKRKFISWTEFIFSFAGSDVYCRTLVFVQLCWLILFSFFSFFRSTQYFLPFFVVFVYVRFLVHSLFIVVLLYFPVCLHPKTMFARKT